MVTYSWLEPSVEIRRELEPLSKELFITVIYIFGTFFMVLDDSAKQFAASPNFLMNFHYYRGYGRGGIRIREKTFYVCVWAGFD